MFRQALNQDAEELVKGALKLYLETVSKHFNFSFNGIDFDPFYIDPVNRAIMNVQFLNDVDISKLIGGVAESYSNYATKAKVEEIDPKFADYTTTVDFESNYATNDKIK